MCRAGDHLARGDVQGGVEATATIRLEPPLHAALRRPGTGSPAPGLRINCPPAPGELGSVGRLRADETMPACRDSVPAAPLPVARSTPMTELSSHAAPASNQ